MAIATMPIALSATFTITFFIANPIAFCIISRRLATSG